MAAPAQLLRAADAGVPRPDAVRGDDPPGGAADRAPGVRRAAQPQLPFRPQGLFGRRDRPGHPGPSRRRRPAGRRARRRVPRQERRRHAPGLRLLPRRPADRHRVGALALRVLGGLPPRAGRPLRGDAVPGRGPARGRPGLGRPRPRRGRPGGGDAEGRHLGTAVRPGPRGALRPPGRPRAGHGAGRRRAAGGAAGARRPVRPAGERAEFRFDTYVEFDSECLLVVDVDPVGPDPTRTVRVEVRQKGATAARATLGMRLS